MQLFAPSYYKKFKCTASKCRHSCCIDWEIDIDEVSIERYKILKSDSKNNIINSIYTDKTDGVSHFKLNKDGKCPHLSKDGLCNIIINLGEDYLCDICREHPRFYNSTNKGIEVGIGAVCEEACKIILESDGYTVIEEIGCVNDKPQKLEFDSTTERNKLFEMLSDKSVPYTKRISDIRKSYGINLEACSDNEWQDTLAELEYIDEKDLSLFSCYTTTSKTDTEYEAYLERFLAYLIYRHGTKAKDERDFRKAVAFSMFCERLLASLIIKTKPKTFDGIIELARIISMEIEYSAENTDSILIDMEFVI